MISWFTAVLKVLATAAPMMRKTVTSSRSAVDDWTTRSIFCPKLADWAMAAKSIVSPAGAAAMLKPARRPRLGFHRAAGHEDGGRRHPQDDEADRRRDQKAEGEPQHRHLPRVLPLESGIGAERHDRADDGGGQHVGHRAGERQPLFDEAPDHDHAAAFAHRKDQPEDTAKQDRGGGGSSEAFWQYARRRRTHRRNRR